MKRILNVIVILLCAVAMLSCSTEKSVISDLRKLDQEVQTKGTTYTQADWTDFANRYRKVLKKQKSCSFTNEQLEEATELNTRIVKNTLTTSSKGMLGRLGSVLSGLKKGLGGLSGDGIDISSLLQLFSTDEEE